MGDLVNTCGAIFRFRLNQRPTNRGQGRIGIFKDEPVWVVKCAQRYHRKIIRFDAVVRADWSLKRLKNEVLYYPASRVEDEWEFSDKIGFCFYLKVEFKEIFKILVYVFFQQQISIGIYF